MAYGNLIIIKKHNCNRMDVTINENLKVLIIEDDLDMCFMLTIILKNRKIPSSFVNSLTDAKKLLKKINPEVILLDNHLPDGKGINFIAYVKAYFPHTVVIMITARSNDYYRNVALANGAAFFIAKPL